jgi:hypothetical protein
MYITTSTMTRLVTIVVAVTVGTMIVAIAGAIVASGVRVVAVVAPSAAVRISVVIMISPISCTVSVSAIVISITAIATISVRHCRLRVISVMPQLCCYVWTVIKSSFRDILAEGN